MADLSVLKGELKAWEKAFKAANGREARKEDIKLDGAIAEKYKIYNKSRKPPAAPGPSSSSTTASARPSSSLKQPPPPIKPSISPSKARQARTGRSSTSPPPAAGPSSARSTRSAPYSTPSKPVPSPFGSTTPSRAKRPPSASSASNANPFLAQPPPRTPSSKSNASLSKPSTPSSASASFHFAASPSKLLSLISAHSSTGVPNDAASLRTTPGWTPRTKARKRLRGEDVGVETPQKKGRKSFGGASLGGPAGPSGKGGLIEEEDEQEDEDEEMLGPSPVKEDDKGVREWFAAKRAALEDDSDSGDETADELSGLPRRLPPLKRNSSSSTVDVKGKGKAFFGAGKMVELSAAAAARQAAATALDTPSVASSSSTARTGKTGSTSATNPFIFSTTATWTDVPSTTGADEGDPSKEGDKKDKDADDSSPPPEKKSKAKKNARKAGPSVPRLTAAKKAKAETALETLKGIIGSEDEEEDADGEGGMGLGVEAGVKIVRGNHLLGKGRVVDGGKGKGRESPAKPAKTRAVDEDKMDDRDDTDAGAEDGWDSQDDHDLFGEGSFSPSKPKLDRNKPRTLYGLPDEHAFDSPEPESPTSAHHSDGETDDLVPDDHSTRPQAPPPTRPKVDLPPHLLSLLSLRSPETQAAKFHARRAQTFHSIFAAPLPPPPPAAAPAPVPVKRKGKGKEPEKEKAVPLPVILPRRNVLGSGRGRSDAGGEVWGIGDEVVVGGDEDEDWASEVEGWKEGGGWGERDEEDW